MPELPEVEVTRQSLAPRIRGALILGSRWGKPLRWPLGCLPQTLVGLKVASVERRGKYLWLALESEGAAAGGLLLHLGMSGALYFAQTMAPPGPHDHFDLVTDQGTLRLTDPRRFGAVVWSQSLQVNPAAKLLSQLGIEPFDPEFDGIYLHAALARRRQDIKLVLLRGDIVVGAGNIYACEALFVAGIHPRTAGDRVSRPRALRLSKAIRDTLAQAVALGGSTLRDFHDVLGSAGGYQANANVYARQGLPCRICQTPIRRIVQGQRSTFFCPTCQRR